ncbi:MAG: Mth938-like domain-containing protein [Gammaproteobacteria bacterium]|nr:Mth938-like domain-containing protein [Gammaproteobacteria bacterium]
MKFTREMPAAITIQSVSDGQIRIGGEIYRKTIALTTSTVVNDWRPCPVADLTANDLAPIVESKPDVLVLGTGPQSEFAPREIVFALARKGIGLEVMDTAAAARTFNVLAGEGRNVAAILYL